MNCPGCTQPADLCVCHQLARLVGELRKPEAQEPNPREAARQLLGDALEQELAAMLRGHLPKPWLHTTLREVRTLLEKAAPESHALTAVAGAILADMVASSFGEQRRGTYERLAALLAIEVLAAELAPPAAPGGPSLEDVAIDLEGLRALAALMRRDMKERERRALERAAVAAAKGET